MREDTFRRVAIIGYSALGHSRRLRHSAVPSSQVVNAELVQVIVTTGACHQLHQIGQR
jgi:hypothetical protein